MTGDVATQAVLFSIDLVKSNLHTETFSPGRAKFNEQSRTLNLNILCSFCCPAEWGHLCVLSANSAGTQDMRTAVKPGCRTSKGFPWQPVDWASSLWAFLSPKLKKDRVELFLPNPRLGSWLFLYFSLSVFCLSASSLPLLMRWPLCLLIYPEPGISGPHSPSIAQDPSPHILQTVLLSPLCRKVTQITSLWLPVRLERHKANV